MGSRTDHNLCLFFYDLAALVCEQPTSRYWLYRAFHWTMIVVSVHLLINLQLLNAKFLFPAVLKPVNLVGM